MSEYHIVGPIIGCTGEEFLREADGSWFGWSRVIEE